MIEASWCPCAASERTCNEIAVPLSQLVLRCDPGWYVCGTACGDEVDYHLAELVGRASVEHRSSILSDSSTSV